MKIISYVGIDEPVMVIERATDLYPALDHIQTRMIELAEDGDEKAEECSHFISKLMNEAEEAGFGNYEDVDKVESA